MNKHVSLVLIVLAAFVVASCAPASPAARGAGRLRTACCAPTAAAAAPSRPRASRAVAPRRRHGPPSRRPRPTAAGRWPSSRRQRAHDRFSGHGCDLRPSRRDLPGDHRHRQGQHRRRAVPGRVQSVNNFVTLAKNGYYDGLTFHRVEPGFVIQGGDPAGDGTGGPGYTIPAEINHTHTRGALAWTRTGDQVNPERRSSGSQFYITLDATPFLDGGYTVFGQVIEGMDVADEDRRGRQDPRRSTSARRTASRSIAHARADA